MRHNKDGVQNWFKRFGLFNGIVFLALSSLLGAQSFEDFKQSQWSAYEDDKAQKEKAFRNFLTAEWKAYKASQGLSVYDKPKPKILPITVAKASVPIGPTITIKPILKAPESEKKPPLEILKEESPRWDITLFATTFSFDPQESLTKARFLPQNKKGITHFFDALSDTNYQKLLAMFSLHVKKHHLNDWALYLLTQKLSIKLYSDSDEQKLFQWFVLNHLGYDIKVGLQNDHVVLLSRSKHLIYSTPNYTLGSHTYYAIDFYNQKSMGSLYTYEGSYPDADRSLDLGLKNIPSFQDNTHQKELSFRYRGQKYTLHVSYNQNLIDFMQSYPQADYESYFNAPLDTMSSRSLINSLKPIVDGKAASEAINILLYFVQHAFVYQVDQEQFGREKVMFAQETLYYQKSDCEDRSILFAYLIKNLLGYDVVGVKYADHMATAIAVPIRGDALHIASHRYVIADPTYINAPIGKSMPKYKDVRPQQYIRVHSPL